MSSVWTAPTGTEPGDQGWKPVGITDSLSGISITESALLPDDKVLFVPYDLRSLNTTTATQSFSFTMSPEAVKNFMYVMAKADIIARMRRDLRNQLNAFARRWGIDYP